MRCYVGLDTETQDGLCILIATPSEYAEPSSWADACRFLFLQAEAPVVDFICWNVSFDAQALLKFLPFRCLQDLDLSGRTLYRSYRIEYVRRKRLSVWWGGMRFNMWDAFPYYDCPLDVAGERFLGDKKLSIPKAWMPRMSEALRLHRKRVIRYCMRDALLTERLWGLVERQYWKIGANPMRAASPGTIALRLMRKSYRVETPADVNRIFQQAYYGGRTEVFKRGRVGRAFRYDIHSAYPSVLARALDPNGCTVRRFTKGGPSDAACYGAYRVDAKLPPDGPVAPLPFRRDDNILLYPAGLWSGWIPLPLLLVLQNLGYMHTVREGVELIPSEKTGLLCEGIEELYQLRKSRPALNIAIKKTLNSLYGKYAEAVRTWRSLKDFTLVTSRTKIIGGEFRIRLDFPTSHTSYIVASHITGCTQARVVEAMMLKPDSIVSVHTDGVASASALPLNFGNGLGEWGNEGLCDNLVTVATGLYCYERNGEKKQATRGYRLENEKGERLFLADLLASDAEFRFVPHRRSLGLGESRRDGYRTLNEFRVSQRVIHTRMDTKRYWPENPGRLRDFLERSYQSLPLVVAARNAGGAKRERKGSEKGAKRERRK